MAEATGTPATYSWAASATAAAIAIAIVSAATSTWAGADADVSAMPYGEVATAAWTASAPTLKTWSSVSPTSVAWATEAATLRTVASVSPAPAVAWSCTSPTTAAVATSDRAATTRAVVIPLAADRCVVIPRAASRSVVIPLVAATGPIRHIVTNAGMNRQFTVSSYDVATGASAEMAWAASVAATNKVSAAASPVSVAWAGRDGTPYQFDPASLALTLWQRPDYGGPPWAGTASAGTSGTHSLTNGTATAFSAGTALNGYTPAYVDGRERLAQPPPVMMMTADGTLADYVNATSFSGWALVYEDPAAVGARYILNAEAAADQIQLFTSGTAGLTVGNGGGAKTVSRAFTTGAYQLITFRYTGTNLQIGVNEAPGAAGGGSTIACSLSIDLSSTLVAGIWSASFFKLHTWLGDIVELALSKSVFDDATFTSVKSYANARYALAL